MERNKIIDAFVKDRVYREICKHIAGAYADDLYQELVLYILEIPDEKLRRLDETCLRCFFYRMAERQFKSKNSAFYNKYFRDQHIRREHAYDIYKASEETAPDSDVFENVIRAMEGLSQRDREMLQCYAELGTFRAVGEKMGMPMISAYFEIEGTRKIIRKKLKKIR